jgi:late competence protein required for DNA uptake (superfamily II DNA/RNA helicase)
MAVKQKRITCARCGERETVTRGERGPASIYCDLCRDEVKREQKALRAQAYRQRKASYGGCGIGPASQSRASTQGEPITRHDCMGTRRTR